MIHDSSQLKKLKLGFIGAGKQAQCCHLRYYSLLPDCEMVALAEPNLDLGRRVAARFGIPQTYGSHPELLTKEKLDAVIVTLPLIPEAERVLLDVLEAGIPMFVEKPLTSSPRSAERIVAAAERTGTLLKVGFHKRCDQATQAAKLEIDRLKASGELGKLTYARIHVSLVGDWFANGYFDSLSAGNTPPPPSQPADPADFPGLDEEARKLYASFAAVQGHQFDLMGHLLGEAYEITHADPSQILLAARSEGGVPVVFEFTPYQSTRDWIESALVCFERGYVRLDLPPPVAIHRSGEVEFFRDALGEVPPQRFRPVFSSEGAMEIQAKMFLDAVRGEPTPLCDSAQANASIQISRSWSERLSSMRA